MILYNQNSPKYNPNPFQYNQKPTYCILKAYPNRIQMKPQSQAYVKPTQTKLKATLIQPKWNLNLKPPKMQQYIKLILKLRVKATLKKKSSYQVHFKSYFTK